MIPDSTTLKAHEGDVGWATMEAKNRISEFVRHLKDISPATTRYEQLSKLVCVCHSGGKDSVVIRHLVDEVLTREIASFHTPKVGLCSMDRDFIDAAHGLSECFNKKFYLDYKNPNQPTQLERLYIGMLIQHPNLVVSTRSPSSFGFHFLIDGTRQEEADREDGRSTDLEVNGKTVSRKAMTATVKKGLYATPTLYPIFDWSDNLVWAYIKVNDLAFSPSYIRAYEEIPDWLLERVEVAK